MLIDNDDDEDYQLQWFSNSCCLSCTLPLELVNAVYKNVFNWSKMHCQDNLSSSLLSPLNTLLDIFCYFFFAFLMLNRYKVKQRNITNEPNERTNKPFKQLISSNKLLSPFIHFGPPPLVFSGHFFLFFRFLFFEIFNSLHE